MLMRFVLAAFLFAAAASAESVTTAEQDAMIEDLIGRMTLDEKAGQLTLLSSDLAVTGPVATKDLNAAVAAGRVGAVFNAYGVKYTDELQQIAVEETRLGIPLLFGHDVVHGFRTIFPIPLAEAASWDLAAIEESARIAAREAAAAGVHWTFAPMVDVSRDPRWGRIAEGAGESPFLGARIAAARVRGFQGDDLAAPGSAAACVKHFAAYGAAAGGRDYNTTDVPERALRETYLPPFRAATEAGVACLMTAFNDLDGVPATANNHLLQDILRAEWGFEGLVVSDYTGIPELKVHGIAADDREAVRLAFTAGTDMDMQSGLYGRLLPDIVRQGKVPEASVDAAVRRVLRLKAALGLFADPYRHAGLEHERAMALAPEHLAAARAMARESMVLLKNDGGVLPLRKDPDVLAVLGPLADDGLAMLGPWHGAGRPEHVVTLIDGVRRAVAPGTKVLAATGGTALEATAAEIEQAVAVARRADAVILALGETGTMSGEAASRADIGLPGDQLALARAVAATGKPVAAVLFNGRPLVLEGLAAAVPALLEAWLPGTTAGDAVADILFGDAAPSGKLPMSFPRSVGQIPVHHDHKPTGRPASEAHYTSRYLDEFNDPLYPFGWGLSYTTFSVSAPRLSRPTIRGGDRLQVTVDVTNIGDRPGTEVVQLYVRDLVGSVTRPVRELKGFRRVSL
ncbi:MAG TPA: beta-glucosidase BglX, partial [Alphaproteobacteria bacterium]|nr:beta-glucosidase BglX [Alphaproteobacteria bacterium]